ncbi:MAG: peptidoglycan DD-metalloendopeptidase family protein [Flavobacteriaceae bacterium]|nr:peptidoglycan DD-metalloendopeptidase family protein [Flavobacteriaceae bacterium]MDG1090807.1 peptidoglycan DD-metalloendopeptidase family protein [Flavobacteriaceae bacterium]
MQYLSLLFNNHHKLVLIFITALVLNACKKNTSQASADALEEKIVQPIPKIKYGYDYNLYEAKEFKIKRGDTFGAILEQNGIDYPEVYTILQVIKKSEVNIRKLKIGKPYTLLFTKDSVPQAHAFIYHPGVESYDVIQLKDSLYAKKVKKPVRVVELQATGVIASSLYDTMNASGYNSNLTYYLADVYAWTIDFNRLAKGDRFKVIYTERFVDDSISIGIEKIKAAYFEHRNKPLYAFEFKTDSIKGIVDYFDDNAKNLRRAFLKAPVSFSRISSRYNLKRRIAYYGRVKPHKGTDYAAAVGTPIMATANGTVTKANYSRGNGNYVKIKHNSTYATQYLHMKRRKVRVGQYVKQGDVIGWVGMTGNTSGPHVCYRFWKNGRQVDPFKQKLPEAKPISKKLKDQFLTYIEPVKTQLNCLSFEENKEDVILALN